jgi:FlaA1/EpsC-like NDP-sugar epimerase
MQVVAGAVFERLVGLFVGERDGIAVVGVVSAEDDGPAEDPFRLRCDDVRLHPVVEELVVANDVGDVRDYQSIDDAFRGVDYVFSAAALKQVPSCEFFPLEAMKTNVIGSDNVITACVNHHVKKAIFLSTDKAAYPVNAMGITKALMEKNVIARSRQLLAGDTILCLTRYGNVMGSRGSVIPLFLSRRKRANL